MTQGVEMFVVSFAGKGDTRVVLRGSVAELLGVIVDPYDIDVAAVFAFRRTIGNELVLALCAAEALLDDAAHGRQFPRGECLVRRGGLEPPSFLGTGF